MFVVEVYAAVRQFVFIEGQSRREAARVFGLSRETIAKMCRFSLPPGYTRSKPVEKPKLGPLLPVIAAILEADRTAPLKQRHTAKRIFERLRDEHGYAGGYTDRPPRGGPSSKLVQGRPLLHGSLGRRSRPGERSRPSGEGRHEHLRGRWSVAERGVRAHAVVV